MIIEKQSLLLQYEEAWQKHFDLTSHNWLASLRKKQFDLFLKKGFPTTREEEWKYTHLGALKKHRFEFIAPLKQSNSTDITKPFSLEGPHYQLVFIDGFFQADLSTIPSHEKVIITNLSKAISEHEILLAKHFEQKSHCPFSFLNTACVQDGVFIYLPVNTKVDRPIHMLFLSNNDSVESLQTIRNIVIIEQNVKALLFEEHRSLNQNPYVANVCTQLYAKESSHIDYIKLQQQHSKSFHISNFEITQKRNSHVRAHHYHLGGEIARECINGYMNEENASLHLQGLYLPLNKQHIDFHTFIHHLADNTESEELYKGVIASKSRAVFNGKIFVAKNVEKVVANLQNKNLLLERDAEINAKPELEIYSEDVICKHGATIGQIDKEMLFYMRSRGIQKEQANQLLLLAFIHELLNAVKDQAVSKKILAAVTNYCEEVVR